MKKIFIIGIVSIMSLVLFSCDDGKELRTYEVFNNCSEIILYEVEVYFYKNGNKVIGYDTYDKIDIGTKTEIKEVPTGSKKAKISFKGGYSPNSSKYSPDLSDRFITTSFTRLEKGKNNIVEIEDETYIIKQQVEADSSDMEAVLKEIFILE